MLEPGWADVAEVSTAGYRHAARERSRPNVPEKRCHARFYSCARRRLPTRRQHSHQLRGDQLSLQPVSIAAGVTDPITDLSRPLRGWQRRALVKYLGTEPRDFLAVATPGSGKTAFALRIAAELLGHRARRADSPSSCPPNTSRSSGRKPRAGTVWPWTRRFSNSNPQTSPEYHGVVVTYAQVAVASDVAPGAHRAAQDPGRLRRDPPRRRCQDLGRRHPRSLQRRHPPTCLDGHPISQRRQPHPVRQLRAGRRRACCVRRPTTPTATPKHSPTAWSGRWCSWPIPDRRAGGTAQARSTRHDWASRCRPSRPRGRGAPRWTPPASGCPR